ncbi:cytochrome P450 4e3-like isoform X2 [Teleopsis dalmanni]|nr:cytochrome P450 4e3-like isoform X2 [Teleopsis dalmanni]
MLNPWLGTGLLTGYGPKWFKHRKMITPSFHFKILQNFHDVMNTSSARFIEKLRSASMGETIFDFQHMAHYLTLDIICATAMGVDIDAMNNSDSELVKAFKDMCLSINMRAYHPLKRYMFIFKHMPEYVNYAKTLAVLQNFTNEVIEKRMQALEKSKNNESGAVDDDSEDFSRKKMAFLDTLLTATIDGRPLTKQEIYEEVSTFMFAGHDTTTSGIAFTIYLLSRHPSVQQKVYEEQEKIMGGNMKREATFQEISDMKYLDLVVKESQRLYPSVPLIARRADQQYDMNGTILPKDTMLNIAIIMLGYNDENFPDPYRCDPDRFDLDKQDNKLNPFAYVPFSAGPRNCIGQKFAQLQLKTVISRIVRTFHILPPTDDLVSKSGYVQHSFSPYKQDQTHLKDNQSKYDPILSAVLTLKSDNGIQIRLRER